VQLESGASIACLGIPCLSTLATTALSPRSACQAGAGLLCNLPTFGLTGSSLGVRLPCERAQLSNDFRDEPVLTPDEACVFPFCKTEPGRGALRDRVRSGLAELQRW
jgi:hypothetical protein